MKVAPHRSFERHKMGKFEMLASVLVSAVDLHLRSFLCLSVLPPASGKTLQHLNNCICDLLCLHYPMSALPCVSLSACD